MSAKYSEVEQRMRGMLGSEADWAMSETAAKSCEKINVVITGDVLYVLRNGQIAEDGPSSREGYPKYKMLGPSPNPGYKQLMVTFGLSRPGDRPEGIKIHLAVVESIWHKSTNRVAGRCLRKELLVAPSRCSLGARRRARRAKTSLWINVPAGVPRECGKICKTWYIPWQVQRNGKLSGE